MAGINTATQFIGYLGPLKMEIGYIPGADISTATGLDNANIGKTHSVPTTLTKVFAGWMVCSSTAGGVIGCLTGESYSVCSGHTSGCPAIDFTMDITCAGGAITSGWGDFYLIFGQ